MATSDREREAPPLTTVAGRGGLT